MPLGTWVCKYLLESPLLGLVGVYLECLHHSWSGFVLSMVGGWGRLWGGSILARTPLACFQEPPLSGCYVESADCNGEGQAQDTRKEAGVAVDVRDGRS